MNLQFAKTREHANRQFILVFGANEAAVTQSVAERNREA